jgi:hypothetical protein
MKPTLFAVCVIGVTLFSGMKTQAQGIAVGVPVYTAPVYAAPVYAAPVYSAPVYAAPVYPTAVYPATTYYSVPDYATTAAYYSPPAAVYAAPLPYTATAPVVVGAPVRVYGHWGRHHAHFYYRW